MRESGHQRAASVKITHHNCIELSVLAPAPYTLLYRLDHIFRFSGDSNRNKKKLTNHSGKQNTLSKWQPMNHYLCKQNRSQLETKNG
jgi:hypothetical protein